LRGRPLIDLVVTLKELADWVSLSSRSPKLDLTTPTGRAMVGLLSVFEPFEHDILRERIRAGIGEARLQGKHLGRPVTVGKMAEQIRKLYRAGVSKAEIARRLDISRTSVRRLLTKIILTSHPQTPCHAPLPEGHNGSFSRQVGFSGQVPISQHFELRGQLHDRRIWICRAVHNVYCFS
jgi:hypothetical protein